VLVVFTVYSRALRAVFFSDSRFFFTLLCARKNRSGSTYYLLYMYNCSGSLRVFSVSTGLRDCTVRVGRRLSVRTGLCCDEALQHTSKKRRSNTLLTPSKNKCSDNCRSCYCGGMAEPQISFYRLENTRPGMTKLYYI
jgi:hypothetical protein